MKVYICTCNNCANIYKDSNPGPDNVAFDLGVAVANSLRELESIDDMRACPECKTDGYLVDNINATALINFMVKNEIESWQHQ